jgi:capsular exopolysaccharide synthesis family protein
MDRPIAAIRRFKYLIIAIVVLATALGFAGTRLITPAYEVRATIWIATETPEARSTVGPIRSAELLRSGAWIELFRSYRIVDEVVRKLALYLEPQNPGQLGFFDGFRLAERFRPGSYELKLDLTADTWTLRARDGVQLERGTATDSVGRTLGFHWKLPPSAFDGTNDNVAVPFVVRTPRETSMHLLDRLGNRLVNGSNFLWLTYTSQDPRLAAQTLNLWVDEYVRVAAELKKRNLIEFTSILEGQLRFAEQATQDAEAAYQQFRVNAITLPTEGGPVAAGVVERDRDPALLSFFDQKIEYDNLRHDREALETSIANAARAAVPYEGLLLIPSVAQSPGAEALREAFRSRYQLRARLTAERQSFTDEYPTVKQLKASVEVLETTTIPQLASQLLQQLREREHDYRRRIESASAELQAIPPRTIEERRLHRAVVVAEGLYTNLKARYAEAKLAEASAAPDVSVLDTAVAPLAPTRNTAATIILLAIIAGTAGAFAVAMLLDRLDGKFRYVEQVVTELGLPVASALPQVPKSSAASSPEKIVQFVESIRTLRMHVMHAAPTGPLTLAVTSAAPADGKSLVSSNLALSCAEAGLRTVLVDGDTRRGTLHDLFGVSRSAGLTEWLMGSSSTETVIRRTKYANLSFVSAGARSRHGPELIASARLKAFTDHLARHFDVVIFDTPPLAAGIDGYAISAAAGHVVLVVRMGRTVRRLATAKLSVLERLPVVILGSVLNEVPLTGEFQYYAYSDGYAIQPDGSWGELTEAATR